MLTMTNDLLITLQQCDHGSRSDGGLQEESLDLLWSIPEHARQQHTRAVSQRVVLIAQQRKELVRRLLVLQQPIRVLQAEIVLRVLGGGVERLAEDGDGFDGRTADVRVDFRVVLDDHEETSQGVRSDQLTVRSGEALEREDRRASVGEESRGRETIAQAGDGVIGCLLYAGWPAKGGVSLLEEFHGGSLSRCDTPTPWRHGLHRRLTIRVVTARCGPSTQPHYVTTVNYRTFGLLSSVSLFLPGHENPSTAPVSSFPFSHHVKPPCTQHNSDN